MVIHRRASLQSSTQQYARSKLSHAVWMLEGNAEAVTEFSNQFRLKCPDAVIQLADEVQAAGSQQSRQFHHLHHFLKVSGNKKTIQSVQDAARFIAGQCHDVVYYKADGGFEPHIKHAIEPYFIEENGTFTIAQNCDAMFEAALRVFGYEEGKTLSPFSGQNEFLSALYAMKMSNKEHLNLAPKYQLMIMAHIEGTIPFGAANHFEELHDRLTEANKFLLRTQKLSENEISETIHTAVAMANKDVSGFDQEYNKFLQDTCKLVREFIPPDKRTDEEAIRAECQNQIKFLSFIAEKSQKDEKKIFHGFHDVPPQEELNAREAKARENISKAVADLAKEETIAAILQMSRRP